MKRYLKLITVLLLGVTVSSCNKVDFDYPEGYVGSSKITFYPTITTKGDQLIIINQGTAYTDAGATVKIGDADGTFTTTGAVDTSKPGVYVLNYSAVNEDGFSASTYRTVVVMSTGSDIAGHDYSGTYSRYLAGAANGQTSTWTKTGNGIYAVENPGGAVLEAVVAVNFAGNSIVIPQQETSVGTFASTVGTYNPTTNIYTWAIINGGYGTAVREFRK